MNKIIQATIYVGLNDSVTHVQKFSTEKYISLLKNICKSYGLAFTMNRISGGYFHDDGTYVEENSLALILLDVEESIVEDVAKDLCAFFNQESVMVTYSQAEVHYVKEKIEK